MVLDRIGRICGCAGDVMCAVQVMRCVYAGDALCAQVNCCVLR